MISSTGASNVAAITSLECWLRGLVQDSQPWRLQRQAAVAEESPHIGGECSGKSHP